MFVYVKSRQRLEALPNSSAQRIEFNSESAKIELTGANLHCVYRGGSQTGGEERARWAG